jgi:hypothetical protein
MDPTKILLFVADGCYQTEAGVRFVHVRRFLNTFIARNIMCTSGVFQARAEDMLEDLGAHTRPYQHWGGFKIRLLSAWNTHMGKTRFGNIPIGEETHVPWNALNVYLQKDCAVPTREEVTRTRVEAAKRKIEKEFDLSERPQKRRRRE